MKRIAIGSLTVLVPALVLAVFFQKPTHADPKATDVIVDNTAAQPVPVQLAPGATVLARNLDDPGRIAFQKTVSMVGQCASAHVCFFEFGPVPSGHRIVVQHVTGLVDFTSDQTIASVLVNNGSGEPISSFAARTLLPGFAFDQPVLAYFDPGSIIEVQINASAPNLFTGGNTEQIVTVSGYELDCTVAACSPISQ